MAGYIPKNLSSTITTFDFWQKFASFSEIATDQGPRFTKYLKICPKIIVRLITSLSYVLHLRYCMIYLTIIVTMR